VSGVEHWCVVSLSSNMTDEKVIYAFGGNLFEGSWTLDYPVYYAAINEFAQIAIKVDSETIDCIFDCNSLFVCFLGKHAP
jgi:hypothetical protein